MNQHRPDLFPFEPAQPDLFANEAPRGQASASADPQAVRARLLAMLGEARAAEGASPWNERTTRLYRIIFPQMANWLPDEEAAQLRRDFEQELSRLKAA
jgi:hypothetical protein